MQILIYVVTEEAGGSNYCCIKRDKSSQGALTKDGISTVSFLENWKNTVSVPFKPAEH